MGTVKKTIGSIPVGRGAWNSTNTYYKENTVTMYGMTFRALSNISANNPPASLSNNVVSLINTDKWQLLAGTPEMYSITTQVQENTQKVNNVLRSLFIAAGAEYDETTGLYSLNGVNNITEEQMMLSYTHKDACTKLDYGRILQGVFLKAIYPMSNSIAISQISNGWVWNSFYTFTECRYLELFRISSGAILDTTDPNRILKAKSLSATFHTCVSLHTVYPINVEDVTFLDLTFYNCLKLKNLRLYGLKVNLSLAQSPLISKESLLYIINNSKANSAITITLHPDAYATLSDDAEIVSALEAKPLVTLVSA